IFPNPSGNFIHVDLSAIANPSTIEIKNNFGQTVYSVNAVRQELDLDVHNWNSGNYYVVITTSSGKIRQYVKSFEVAK
ncbi:MAG: T9SS type A sorting domain-containing protein, partial [Chitinophagales bacterium]